jgi:hypothetical protein
MQVLGSGTVLDMVSFKRAISSKLKVGQRLTISELPLARPI